MNDVQFAFAISPRIGQLYESAKQYGKELPAHGLTQLRGVAHLICNLLGELGKVNVSDILELDRKIIALSNAGQIGPSIRTKLHCLRVNGNIGTHPEKYYFTKHQLVEIYAQSVITARELLAIVFQRLNPDSPLPTVDVIDDTNGSMKELCYKAMIEADSEARFTAGKLFLAKAAELKRKFEEIAETGQFAVLGADYHTLLDQAFFWFKLGADAEHAPSMYEYGLALADGVEGAEKKGRGEYLVYRASKLGNANADAFIGQCYLFGSVSFEKDYTEAREHLERAAAEDHPGALANLGAMHAKGWGGPADEGAAVAYTRRAAEAGYPQGQYNLSIFYFNGRGVEVDELQAMEWLEKASDQGYPPAMLAMADRIVSGDVAGKSWEDAEQLYIRCLSSQECGSSARHRLAVLFANKGDVNSLLKAADLLQACFESEPEDSELAQDCWNRSPIIVKQLRDRLSPSASTDQVAAAMLTLSYFDAEGRPTRNRAERRDAFYKNMAAAAKKVLESGKLRAMAIPIEEKSVLREVQQRPNPVPPGKKGGKVGRNEPCPCGSGKKSKICCYR